MPPTTDLLLLALVLLIAVVVAARAYMAARGLGDAAASVRRRASRLEDGAPTLVTSLADLRWRLSDVDAGIERALSRLSRFDEDLTATRRSLAERRTTLDTIRMRHLVTASELLHRARTAARIVMAALRMRRSFPV